MDEEPNQWILTAGEYMALSSSRQTTLSEENANRYKATGLIQSLGMVLKLPQTTIATAQMFLHRFYIRESFKTFSYQEVSPAIVFLAAKVEEHPRKIRDVVFAFQSVLKGIEDTALREDSDEFNLWRQRIMSLERIILRVICFDLTVIHPYRLVLQLVKEIKDVPDELVQTAWTIVNGTYRTSLCIMYPSRTIAVAAICYAAEKKEIPIVTKDDLIFNCSRPAIDGRWPFVYWY